MGKVLKVQLTCSKNIKSVQSFRCPNCNEFINKKEEDLSITCPNCNTILNVKNDNGE